jgi:hypothetical protein
MRGARFADVSEPKPARDETPFEQFRKLTATVMAVPKSKIDEREIKYRAARKNKNRKRHR